MSKTFKFLNARQEGAKDTELMARSSSDKLDLELAQIDLRAPLKQHADLNIYAAPVGEADALSVFHVARATGNIDSSGTLDVSGDATFDQALKAGADRFSVNALGTLVSLTDGAEVTPANVFSVDDQGALKVHSIEDIASPDSLWSIDTAGKLTVLEVSAGAGKLVLDAAGTTLSMNDGAETPANVLEISDAGVIKAQSIRDIDSTNLGAAQLWEIAADGSAKLVSIQATDGLFSMSSQGKITGQALSAGNDKFQVMSDGSKISLNDGVPAAAGLPTDMFSVDDEGAILAHSIADIANPSLWSISTAGVLTAQDAQLGSATISGILAQDEDLRMKKDKKIRFWDSTAAVGQEDMGFIGYSADEQGVNQITIDPSPIGANGEVIIEGSLRVTGTTTTVNSTEVEISDKLFRVAKDSANLADANGAGLEVGNDLASFKYDHNAGSGSHWDLTHSLTVAAEVKSATLDVETSAVLASAQVSDLTVAGGVVLAGAGGELEDSDNLTFDGSALTVTGSASVSGDLDASAGKLSTDASNSLVKIKDYGLNILDAASDPSSDPVVKASISSAGVMELASDLSASAGKFEVKGGESMVKIKDYGITITDTTDPNEHLVKASISSGGAMTLEGAATIKNRLAAGANGQLTVSGSGDLNIKAYDAVSEQLSQEAKFSVDSATGSIDSKGTADIASDLKVATDQFVVTAATGAVNLKGDLSSDQTWSISSAGLISAVEAQLSGDLKARGEKFHVDGDGQKINISGYSLHIDDADPSTPSDVFKVSASGDLDADGVAQLFKYTDTASNTDMFAFRVYDANAGVGTGTGMPTVLSNVGMTVVGELSAQSTLNAYGMVMHTGEMASFGSGILQVQAAVAAEGGTGGTTVPGGSAGGGGAVGSGTPASIKASVNVLPAMGSGGVMPDLGAADEEWENVFAKNLHAEAMNLDSLLFTGSAPESTVPGQLWYDNTAGKLYFQDDEGISVLGENDQKQFSEREISLNYFSELDAQGASLDDGQNAELRIYRHEVGQERATSVAIKSAGSTDEQGSEMHLQAGLLMHDQAEADKPSSARNINIDKNILVDVSMFEILVIDGANDGFKKFDAETDVCPFGQARMSVTANTAYDGHVEMKDRELGWVILSGTVATSLPSFGDSLYYGAGTHAGKAVDHTTADSHVDAQGEPAGFVIEVGHVLKTADITDNNGQTYKCAYVQFCFDKKYQN